MTHAELVQRAAAWLRRRHPIVITEMAGSGEEPDAIGFRHGFSTLVECKASRADFLADKRKGEIRMGDKRWYLVPRGLINADELPPRWGLLYADARCVVPVRDAEHCTKKNCRAEHSLLVSCIRRIGKTSPTCVSVKFYTYQTKNRATLGIAVE